MVTLALKHHEFALAVTIDINRKKFRSKYCSLPRRIFFEKI